MTNSPEYARCPHISLWWLLTFFLSFCSKTTGQFHSTKGTVVETVSTLLPVAHPCSYIFHRSATSPGLRNGRPLENRSMLQAKPSTRPLRRKATSRAPLTALADTKTTSWAPSRVIRPSRLPVRSFHKVHTQFDDYLQSTVR